MHLPQRDQHHITAWVVDSDRVIASTLATILRNAGYRVEAFAWPEEALQAARTEQPDLLIADVTLPGLSGIDLAVAMRDMHPGCKVLLLSAQANTSEGMELDPRIHGLKLLAKPLHPNVLLAAAATLLG
jgi:DNA-binding response OmpR family regulator